MTLVAFSILFAAALGGYILNRMAADRIRKGGARLHSLSGFHGMYSALVVGLPGLFLLTIWLILQGPVSENLMMSGLPDGVLDGLDAGKIALIRSEITQIANGNVFGTPDPWKIEAAERLISLNAAGDRLMVVSVALLVLAGLVYARSRVSSEFRARHGVEAIILGLMVGCSGMAVVTTAGIVFSLIYESWAFFELIPLQDFLFGLNWEPQIAIRADQVAGAGAFGVIPVFLGTLVIMTVALVIAVPIGLFAAIYLNEFAAARTRNIVKPLLEILSGIPTIVYGFFAILTVAPFLREMAAGAGLTISPNTALAGGGVMAIMLIPFISSFTDDALAAVPQSLRDGSLALGATRGETMLKVLFPAAIPGIVGGVLLAVSRAIGETMIVVMAAGLIAKLTINPLDSVTTVTVQIVTLLIGDTEFDNPKTLAAFALGMLLFVITLGINILALRIVRKYRELYD
ncbi:MAG: phosphate ABC transporter permease subunit PstC [Rhodobacterales bacterium]|nr:phosphate ABC transporter permease subunit PstC [Rhodobacterales bacterium]